MAADTPASRSFTPAWLAPADVKGWLKLDGNDVTDDALILQVCAAAEPYVQQCRPEWRIPIVAEAQLRLDAEYYSTQAVIRVDEWEAAHETTLVDGRGHIVKLISDPADDWGVLDPAAPVQVLYDADTGLDVLPLLDPDGTTPVTVGRAIVWVTQHTPIVLRSTGTAFTGTSHATDYLPDAETYQGAVMYAAREYRRRNSPGGIEVYGEGVSFVSRFDPDIDRALRTGPYAPPIIA